MAGSPRRRLALAAQLFALNMAVHGHPQSGVQNIPTPDSQRPLRADIGSANIPLKQILDYDLAYVADVGLGTPPQALRLRVEINSADTYVRDVVLSDNYHHCKDARFFSGRTSGTMRTNATRGEASFDDDLLAVSGIVAEDVVRFGPLRVPAQGFLDADEELWNGISYDDYCGMDGVVGFSDSNATSTLGFPGPFLGLVENGGIDAALFALRLREPAQLSIGQVNQDLFRGSITHIPLHPRDEQDGPLSRVGSWHTTIDYLVAGSGPALRYELGGLTASFHTASAFCYVPLEVFTNLIMDSLVFEEMPLLPPSIDCSQRGFLPDLTFNFAGKNVTISPYDYTLRWSVPDGPIRCVTAILPTATNEVLLGSAFLRGVYSVFDLDTQTIGFAALS